MAVGIDDMIVWRNFEDGCIPIFSADPMESNASRVEFESYAAECGMNDRASRIKELELE